MGLIVTEDEGMFDIEDADDDDPSNTSAEPNMNDYDISEAGCSYK